ncbi:MAG: hypothetical protein ACLVJH_04525 [Faecalibacterium prausnitzii]
MEYYARRADACIVEQLDSTAALLSRRKRAPGTSFTSLSCLPPTLRAPAGGGDSPPGCAGPLAFSGPHHGLCLRSAPGGRRCST